LTIGQFPQPRPQKLKVEKYDHPAEFQELRMITEHMGIPLLESGPLVRSFYYARELFEALSTKN
jgi:lipoic acid synthetase